MSDQVRVNAAAQFRAQLDDLRPKLEEKAPVHPFEIRIAIGANDWDYALRVMRELVARMEKCGPDRNVDIASGGWSGCHSLTCQSREITAEEYRKELSAWFERQPKAVTP
jgi:hypothetical protein